jgi:hypothetical protein
VGQGDVDESVCFDTRDLNGAYNNSDTNVISVS